MDKSNEEKARKNNDNTLDTAKEEELLKTGNVAMGEDLQTNPNEETRVKDDQKKVDENTSVTFDTAKLQELFDTMSAMAAVNLPTDTTQGSTSKDTQERVNERANTPLNAARLQEMLHTANVFSALDLPPDLREKVEETKHLGEELLEAMNGFMEMGDEFEQRRKLEKSQKNLEDDKNL